VRNWPTPQARDHKGQRGKHTKGGRDLSQDAHGHHPQTICTHGGGCKRCLNPRFVAWLMGFLLDWCEIDGAP
jgi:hypothetical protein